LKSFFLVGPTCAGKSAVAQWIAEQSGRDIVSADSMLVYRGMDIGTAKPSFAERARAHYWLLDVVEPCDRFSVGLYREQALAALREIRDAGRQAIVAGGSGLYLKVLIEGLVEKAEAFPGRPGQAPEDIYRTGGLTALQEALRECSPRLWAELADPANPRRLMRALEWAAAGRKRLPDQWSRHGAPAASVVGVTFAADVLRRRIDDRVAAMYAGGLLDEAAALRTRYPEWSRTARQAIGYAEALAFLQGRCDLAEAQSVTAARTRQLAKRQRTWFRTQMNVCWVERTEDDAVSETAQKVTDLWNANGATPVADE
jgi:tRNA dimethylallyltransferase